MPRPVWNGTISFGLVAIPIKLYHAVRHQSVSFNQLDDRTMSRIRYKKVSALDGLEVPEDHIVKGYEVSKDRYVVVDPDELEPFIPVATKTIDLQEFVDFDEIDPVFFETSYYVAPGTNAKPYALLAQAMQDSGKVAIGRFVMRNKQHIAAIRAEDGLLVMSTLAYADEVIDPATIEELSGISDVEVSDREVAMAEALVASLSSTFEPEKYRDEYREQVRDLIEMKASGQELVALEEAPERPNVIDLMAALEASVQAAKAARGAPQPAGGDVPSEAASTPTKAAGKTVKKTASAKEGKADSTTKASGRTKKSA